MSNLTDLMAYTIRQYPYDKADDLSNARMTKLIFLMDWLSCINDGRQITKINWYTGKSGPSASEVKVTAESSPNLFIIHEGTTECRKKKLTVGIRDFGYEPKLSRREMNIANKVIEATHQLPWADFINLIYSTYPVASSERETYLDLAVMAKAYSKLR